MTTEQFAAWLHRLSTRWPQVGQVALVGSRARGTAEPASDWDVVVYLWDDCYQAVVNEHGVTEYQQVDKVEQRIALDPELQHEAIDVFFLRPGGALGRWTWLDLEALLTGLGGGEQRHLEEATGLSVECLCEMPEQAALEQILGSIGDEHALWPLRYYLEGKPLGDFNPLYRSLDSAKIVYCADAEWDDWR